MNKYIANRSSASDHKKKVTMGQSNIPDTHSGVNPLINNKFDYLEIYDMKISERTSYVAKNDHIDVIRNHIPTAVRILNLK